MVACIAAMSVVAALQLLANHPDRTAVVAGFVVVMIAWCALLALAAVVVEKRRQQTAARRQPPGAQLNHPTPGSWPATPRDEVEEMSR
jgi:heme/copper-type cytochrome/quinol oxidase subunit 2